MLWEMLLLNQRISGKEGRVEEKEKKEEKEKNQTFFLFWEFNMEKKDAIHIILIPKQMQSQMTANINVVSSSLYSMEAYLFN